MAIGVYDQKIYIIIIIQIIIIVSFLHTRSHTQLSASMDNCHTQFSSKETGSTVADNEKMIKNLEELKIFIEQTAEVVQSLGKKLLELLLQSDGSNKNTSPWLLSPIDVRRINSTEGMTTLSRTPKSRRSHKPPRITLYQGTRVGIWVSVRSWKIFRCGCRVPGI